MNKRCVILNKKELYTKHHVEADTNVVMWYLKISLFFFGLGCLTKIFILPVAFRSQLLMDQNVFARHPPVLCTTWNFYLIPRCQLLQQMLCRFCKIGDATSASLLCMKQDFVRWPPPAAGKQPSLGNSSADSRYTWEDNRQLLLFCMAISCSQIRAAMW